MHDLNVPVNWFRREYRRTESIDSHEENDLPGEGGFIRQASLHQSSKNETRVSGRFEKNYVFSYNVIK